MNPSLKIRMRMTKTMLLLSSVPLGMQEKYFCVHAGSSVFFVSCEQQGYFCSSANQKHFRTAVPGDTLDYVNEWACHFLKILI